jgi:hypothetical protein
LGFDLTFYQDSDTACQLIKKYSEKWFRPLVSIHRGQEYKKNPNHFQVEIAHTLVDCWAKLIVWHHPHIRQWSETYKNIPIIYSLWNFLFDQWKSPDTKKSSYVLLHIPISWQTTYRTGSVNFKN